MHWEITSYEIKVANNKLIKLLKIIFLNNFCFWGSRVSFDHPYYCYRINKMPEPRREVYPRDYLLTVKSFTTLQRVADKYESGVFAVGDHKWWGFFLSLLIIPNIRNN